VWVGGGRGVGVKMGGVCFTIRFGDSFRAHILSRTNNPQTPQKGTHVCRKSSRSGGARTAANRKTGRAPYRTAHADTCVVLPKNSAKASLAACVSYVNGDEKEASTSSVVVQGIPFHRVHPN
jgi:hypothetical protein